VPTTVTVRAVFTPLDSGVRSDVVARRLAEAIRLGLLLDGERLPTESRLAAQLGVSTVTAREALATLRSLGLVETKRGRSGGSFVRAPADHHAARLEAPLLRLSLHELRDIGDHRAAVASAAAMLAADRALEDDVNGLREHFERLRAATGLTERRRADARLHIEIAAAAQSPRLTREEISLWSQVGDLVWLPLSSEPEVASVIAEHAALIEAIAEQNAERARDLAQRHVGAETERLMNYRLELSQR
jgi:GntR family transcriptional regulator, transcriptional repressor for pyruvate dehydrogenase complex